MSRDNTINIAEPGKPVGGGTFQRLSWNTINDALREGGILRSDELIDAVEIDQRGLTI